MRLIMKRRTEAPLFLALLTAALHGRQFAQVSNRLEIAALHWYAAGHAAQFAAGSQPSGLVLVGDSMW